jgi:hypothetical protein
MASAVIFLHPIAARAADAYIPFDGEIPVLRSVMSKTQSLDILAPRGQEAQQPGPRH